MVLVTPIIDRAAGLLRVSFPSTSDDASLPGYSVQLYPSANDVHSWESAPESYMHGMTLPPSVVPLAVDVDAGGPSPSEQWSTYLGTRVRFCQVATERFSVRSIEGPVPEPHEIAYKTEEMQTGFADGYPMLVATEGEHASAAMVSITDSVYRITQGRPIGGPRLVALGGITLRSIRTESSPFSTECRAAGLGIGMGRRSVEGAGD